MNGPKPCATSALWKIVFMEQRTAGTLAVWADPFVRLRLPKIINLRTDPYKFAPIARGPAETRSVAMPPARGL